jgi:hypothetical protein
MMDKKEALDLITALRSTKGTQYQQQARSILWQIIGQIIRGDKNRQKLDQAKVMLENVDADPAFAKQFVAELQKTQPVLQQHKKHWWQR